MSIPIVKEVCRPAFHNVYQDDNSNGFRHSKKSLRRKNKTFIW